MGHLLFDDRGCRVSWAMMAEVAFRIFWGMRLLSDVCGYPVSRIVSVDVWSEGVCFACRILSVTCFFPKVWGKAILKKLNAEMRICRTKFGIVTLIFEPLGRYLCWWRIRSSPRISSAH